MTTQEIVAQLVSKAFLQYIIAFIASSYVLALAVRKRRPALFVGLAAVAFLSDPRLIVGAPFILKVMRPGIRYRALKSAIAVTAAVASAALTYLVYPTATPTILYALLLVLYAVFSIPGVNVLFASIGIALLAATAEGYYDPGSLMIMYVLVLVLGSASLYASEKAVRGRVGKIEALSYVPGTAIFLASIPLMVPEIVSNLTGLFAFGADVYLKTLLTYLPSEGVLGSVILRGPATAPQVGAVSFVIAVATAAYMVLDGVTKHLTEEVVSSAVAVVAAVSIAPYAIAVGSLAYGLATIVAVAAVALEVFDVSEVSAHRPIMIGMSGEFAPASESFLKRITATLKRITRIEKEGGERNYLVIGSTRIRSRIGPYRVIDFLGEGGYAFVMLAEDDEGRRYALKVVKPVGGKPPGPKEIRAIFQEMIKMMDVKVAEVRKSSIVEFCRLCGDPVTIADALNKMRRYIITVHAYNSSVWEKVTNYPDRPVYRSLAEYAENPPYVVLEYADRGHLGQVREEVIKSGKAIDLMDEVAGTLSFFLVATRGGIHRDIKPENILIKTGVRGKLEPRLTDFGIVARLGEVSEQGWAFGTPQYMPPEYLLYAGWESDPAYDVYSLGVTFYEFLTGSLPVRQIFLMAVSRHPLLPPSLKTWAAKMSRVFEEGFIGVPGLITREVERIVYSASTREEEEVALSHLADYVEVGEIGSMIYDAEKRALENALVEAGLSVEVADVILRAMSLDPSRRFKNALEFWYNLRRALRRA